MLVLRFVMLLSGMALFVGISTAQLITLEKVPAAVKDSLKTLYKGAEIEEYQKASDLTLVMMKYQKDSLTVAFDSEGKVVQVSKKIATDAIPKKVSDAISAKVVGGETVLASEVTTKGKQLYDIRVWSDKDKLYYNMVLDDQGKVLQKGPGLRKEDGAKKDSPAPKKDAPPPIPDDKKKVEDKKKSDKDKKPSE